MADLTREGLNNQKRGVCVLVSDELTGAQVNGTGSVIATLPDKSVVTAIKLLVTTAAAADTVDIDYAGEEIGSELSTGTAGVVSEDVVPAYAYSDTGGDIVIRDGAEAVAAGFRGRLLIEYIELDKVTGEYTG